MGGFRGLTTCLALVALSACSGGGGGGSVTATSTPAPAPPPASVSLLDSGDSLSFANGAFTSGSSSPDGAQVTLTADANGNARFITLDIPLRGATSYNHTFDLASALQANPGSPLAGFILIRDGVQLADRSFPNNLVLDPTLNFSSYGLWVNVQAVDATGHESGAVGAIAFGNMTPVSGLPSSGSATYTGKTIGAAITGTSQSLLAGAVSLNADFGLMKIGGTLTVNDITSGTPTPWGTLTLAPTAILPVTGGAYGGINNLSGNIPGGAVATSSLNGHFYGPAANETAGTWSVANSTTHAVGAYGAARP
jgi:hypothetical protein